MTVERAAQLRPKARRAFLDEVARYGVPRDVMMLADHPYHLVVTDIYRIPHLRPHTSLLTADPRKDWPGVAAVLDRWGWP